MLILTCPNCGPRNVSEYRYGGEYCSRPSATAEQSDAAWASYVYMRRNAAKVQKEWWLHSAGCGIWFMAERNSLTGQVERTYYQTEKDDDAA